MHKETSDIISMNEKMTAKLTGLSVHTLRSYRHKGIGLPYRKIGSKVLYDRQAVIDWLNKHPLQHSTTENRKPLKELPHD